MKNQYDPDYAVHPGEIIKEELEARKIEVVDFARECFFTEALVRKILDGKAPVTSSIAIRFGKVLGITPKFFENLQRNYQEHQQKKAP